MFGQNITEHNPAPSPSGYPLLSGDQRYSPVGHMFRFRDLVNTTSTTTTTTTTTTILTRRTSTRARSAMCKAFADVCCGGVGAVLDERPSHTLERAPTPTSPRLAQRRRFRREPRAHRRDSCNGHNLSAHIHACLLWDGTRQENVRALHK